jgi:hypothetical protein
MSRDEGSSARRCIRSSRCERYRRPHLRSLYLSSLSTNARLVRGLKVRLQSQRVEDTRDRGSSIRAIRKFRFCNRNGDLTLRVCATLIPRSNYSGGTSGWRKCSPAFGLTIRIRRFLHRRAAAAFGRKQGSSRKLRNAPNAGRCTFTFRHARSASDYDSSLKVRMAFRAILLYVGKGGSSGQSRN